MSRQERNRPNHGKNQIGYDGILAKNSLRGIKAFASGIFKEAERLGYFNGPNPVRDVRVPDGQEPEETYAYTLEEIADILSRLPEPAATIFAIAAYAGLRRGEIEGLQWPDYYDREFIFSEAYGTEKCSDLKRRRAWLQCQ